MRVTTYSGEPIIERLMVVPTGGLILNAQTLDSKRGMSVSRDIPDFDFLHQARNAEFSRLGLDAADHMVACERRENGRR